MTALTVFIISTVEIAQSLRPTGSDAGRPDRIQEASLGSFLHHRAAAAHDRALNQTDLFVRDTLRTRGTTTDSVRFFKLFVGF